MTMDDLFRGRRGRRRLLATSVALAGLPVAGAIDGFLVTPRRLETSVHAFGAAAMPAARVRIAHVSDLHMRSCDAVHRQ
ncbi:MAG: hypothetical protein ACKOYJ_11125, partial [Planctomycetia bacterium]